ncbi:MAG: alginate O-acetyltransferase AlgX-related protein [Bacteroidales bacterium]
MKKVLTYSYIFFFGLLICVVGTATLLKYARTDIETFTKIEKRKPAVLPKWSWQTDSADQYFTGMDAYLNDAFAFRTNMIETYSSLLFSVGSSARPDRIVPGKNGYLFLGNSFHRIIDHTEGKTLFSQNELDRWLLKFSQRKEYLGLFDIPFYVVVVPKKHVVYPEYLPGYIIPSDINNMQQILDSKPGFNLLHLKDSLRAAKEEWGDYLYNKTDSHWSEIGAYAGYLKIMNRLKAEFEKLEPIKLSKSDFNINTHPGWQNKHLLHLTQDLKDYNVEIQWSHKWDSTMIKTNYDGDTLPFSYKDEVTYREKVIIQNDDKPYTLLLLEDSFSVRMSVYLNQSFGRIIYCHYNDEEARELTQLIHEFQPDLVLYELGEQSLFLHQDAHPNVIDAIVENKYAVVKTWDGRGFQQEISNLHQISEAEVVNSELRIRAAGNDPNFRFPAYDFTNGKHALINIEITSPGKTMAQIFFIPDGEIAYTGENSVTVPVKEGKNNLSFHVPAKELATFPIRFDPGLLTGTYVIHSVEFREEK